MDEKEVILRAQKGDIKAFEEIVELYQKRVFSFAYSYVRNRSDAEDITQDVFWKLFIHIKKFNTDKKFFSWIYAILINTIMSFFKGRKKHKTQDSDEEFVQNIAWNDGNRLSTEDKLVLFQALDTLKPEEKNLLLLKYMEDLTIKEISEIAQLSEENVKVRIFRAKEKLVQVLKKEAL